MSRVRWLHDGCDSGRRPSVSLGFWDVIWDRVAMVKWRTRLAYIAGYSAGFVAGAVLFNRMKRPPDSDFLSELRVNT